MEAVYKVVSLNAEHKERAGQHEGEDEGVVRGHDGAECSLIVTFRRCSTNESRRRLQCSVSTSCWSWTSGGFGSSTSSQTLAASR